MAFEALEAEALDRVLFDGGEFGAQAAVGSAEEAGRRPGGRGAPGSGASGGPGAVSRAAAERSVAAHRAIPALRKELNGLVGAWHHRTGLPHGAVHTELRQVCGGPLAAQATAEHLQARIDLIRQWALRRR